MKKEDIVKSGWAKTFKKEAPGFYERALELASALLEGGAVTIQSSDEHDIKGNFVFAIIPDAEPEFWLDGFIALDDAITLCNRMGWKIREINGVVQ